MLNKSIILATQAHEGQVRKNSGLPYITHPLALVQTLIGYGVIDEEILSLAVLHDVPEDCAESFTQTIVFDQEYDDKFFEDLRALSKEKTEGLTQLKLNQASYRSQLVKLADIEHNTREGEIYQGYFAKKLKQVHVMEKVFFHPLYHVLIARFV